MNQITRLAGTDTFETWFNRTNTVIDSLNTVNPKLISVRDYGATGDGVTDDTTGISAAFMALKGISNGILYFPKGNYLLGTTSARLNRQIEVIMNRPFHLKGDNAKITCGLTAEYMWYLYNKGHDVRIEGLEFNGNNKALACLRIEDFDGCTGIIDISNSAFNNTYQSGDLGMSKGGGGLFINGSKFVNLNNCVIMNHSRAIGTGTPVSAGTVGVNIAGSGNGYPKTVTVSGCYFENITNNETAAPLNNDCDCLSVFTNLPNPNGSGITYPDASAVITGNHFKNCKGRSIKIQNDRTVISNNTFYRDVLPITTATEVNAQIAIGHITNNNFYYTPTPEGLSPFIENGVPDAPNANRSMSIINFFSNANARTRAYTVSGNQVVNMVPKSLGILRNFIGCARSSAGVGVSGPLFFTATDNKIVGPCQFFANVTTYSTTSGDTSSTHYVFTNNMVDQLTDCNSPGITFGFLWTGDATSVGVNGIDPAMNRISLINNVNASGNTAGLIYSSSVFNGSTPVSTWEYSWPNAHKINNYKIS